VKENIEACGFSNVSNDTFGVYPWAATSGTVEATGECGGDMIDDVVEFCPEVDVDIIGE